MLFFQETVGKQSIIRIAQCQLEFSELSAALESDTRDETSLGAYSDEALLEIEVLIQIINNLMAEIN